VCSSSVVFTRPSTFSSPITCTAPSVSCRYSGPSPVASLATVLAGLDVNERRGEALRETLHGHTARVLECLARLGVAPPNDLAPFYEQSYRGKF